MLKILSEVMKDLIHTIRYFIESNLRSFGNLLLILLPFMMLFIGQVVYHDRGYFAIGGEIFVPVLIGIIIYIVKQYANKIGKGSDIPVPERRFTEVDEWDEVSIESSRTQEMILYMADLEDWLQRKGLL